MIEDLIQMHLEVMSTLPKDFKRYLCAQIDWSWQGICIVGDRGVGKTTMVCQNLLEKYKTPNHHCIFLQTM